jgi:hypothetical protein
MNPRRFEECVANTPVELTVGRLINEIENQQAEIEKLIYGIREKLDNSPKAPTEGGISVDAGYIDRLKDIARKNDNLINNYLIQISEML